MSFVSEKPKNLTFFAMINSHLAQYQHGLIGLYSDTSANE